MRAWTRRPDGIAIAVRVTPRSARDILTSGTEAHFAARLSAPPVEGAANAALIALVADRFGLPKRDVRLVAGETSRVKRLHLMGDIDALARIAASLYEATP